jgi:type III pantothenate kinase
MNLAIDMGNTSINLAVIRGKVVVREYQLLQKELKKSDAALAQLLKKIKKASNIEEVILCSVVPEKNRLLEKQIKKVLGKKLKVVGRDVKVPIKNKYAKPGQVGQDRLVVAYAARELYGTPAVVIDFGTAITFDLVNKLGHYEGGIIVPGMSLSAETLSRKTALLPRIDRILPPTRLVGKNTKESILSGLFFGYGALSAGLIDMMARSIKGRPKVIVTKGLSHLMKRFISKKVSKIDPHLVFKGLALLLNKSQN